MFQVTDTDDDDDFTEEQEDEWIRLSFTMTDEEREQNERAMAAFREHLGKSLAIHFPKSLLLIDD